MLRCKIFNGTVPSCIKHLNTKKPVNFRRLYTLSIDFVLIISVKWRRGVTSY